MKIFITKCIVLFLLCLSYLTHSLGETKISETGYWVGEEAKDHHAFDNSLAFALAEFFKAENASSIVDFGCGLGQYMRILLDNNLQCEGYDGNPSTPILTNNLAKVLDLSVPFNLEKSFDWVMSLEVGEHLPPQFETIFIENLVRHCRKGIVLSWAIKGQGGYGHFNEQNNDYIKAIFVGKYGFTNDLDAEDKLRSKAQLSYLKNTIMVFRKVELK